MLHSSVNASASASSAAAAAAAVANPFLWNLDDPLQPHHHHHPHEHQHQHHPPPLPPPPQPHHHQQQYHHQQQQLQQHQQEPHQVYGNFYGRPANSYDGGRGSKDNNMERNFEKYRRQSNGNCNSNGNGNGNRSIQQQFAEFERTLMMNNSNRNRRPTNAALDERDLPEDVSITPTTNNNNNSNKSRLDAYEAAADDDVADNILSDEDVAANIADKVNEILRGNYNEDNNSTHSSDNGGASEMPTTKARTFNNCISVEGKGPRAEAASPPPTQPQKCNNVAGGPAADVCSSVINNDESNRESSGPGPATTSSAATPQQELMDSNMLEVATTE